MKDKRAPFTEWKPAISAEEVFSDVIGLSEIQTEGKKTYWLEMRPIEEGRYVIVQRDETGKLRDITQPGFNVRNRVHEYGGGGIRCF